MIGEKQVSLVALEEPPEPSGVSLFERLAKDQNVDVDKLERLMQMHERATARLAQEKFNAAMSAAQTEMRPVAVDSDNPQTKSKYASYEAIDRVLRPIYTKHGFGLSFDTGEGAPDQWVRVLCYVTHAGGYARTYHADMPADGKGAKGGDVMTRTHAVGAAMSYGMRYLLKMIFNVAVGDEDTDGNQENDIPDPPDGFQKWWDGLKHSAKQGSVALEAAWTCSADEPYKSFRKYVATYGANQWTALRAEARRVKA